MSDESRISLLVNPKDCSALVHSSYAKLAQYVAPALMDRYDVRLHTTVGFQMNTLTWTEPHSKKTLEFWSGGSGAYGEDIIPLHLRALQQETKKPSVLMFIGDTIALDQVPKWARSREIPAVAWSAIDWEWPTPKWALEKLGSFLRLWPMSRHGHNVLTQDHLPNLGPPLWLGCNTDIWKPDDRSKYPQVMQSMGFRDDTFNVISVFANQWLRKGEYEMLAALGDFHRQHPEAKIRFFGLTQVRREWDLAALSEHLGIQDIVRWSDDYSHVMGKYPEEDVAMMVNAADCVMSLGYEGFGFQTIEAMALNKPVIGLNAGATPELLRTGILVPPAKDYMFTNMIRRVLPDGPKVVEALWHVYQNRDDKRRWSGGRQWVLDNFTWKIANEAVLGQLRDLEQRIADEDLLGMGAPGPLATHMATKTRVVG
jgi:glycosyltransferase involved in cell wall biosynthesis